MPSRISLGTVQFGLDYGIANKNGKVPRQKIFEILKSAHTQGISCLDTAYDYGDSEDVIGAYLKQHANQFEVVSKLPALASYAPGKAEEFLRLTLKRTSLTKLYGYLVHKFENFLTYQDLWEEFIRLKNKNLVDRIGFSLYAPAELEILFEKDITFDLIQVPYSVFDRRFEKYFDILKKRQVEVHVRSVFLQGLAFLDPDRLPGNLVGAKENIKNLRKLASNNNVPVSAICLNYVLQNRRIDKIVIGVDNPAHLKNNMLDDSGHLKGRLEDLIIYDDNILMPYKWELGDSK